MGARGLRVWQVCAALAALAGAAACGSGGGTVRGGGAQARGGGTAPPAVEERGSEAPAPPRVGAAGSPTAHGGIYELVGVEPGLPHDDLAPLAAMLAGRDVVGLGESIHTSRGYYRAKHRLFRYLVEELGFRVLAFETRWTPAEAVAAYVRTCEGNSREIVSQGLIHVWPSESVRELVEWMCAYNRTHPEDPVSFFGFDIQQPWEDGPRLKAFLEQIAPARTAALGEGISRCACAATSSRAECKAEGKSAIPDEKHRACLAALEEAQEVLDAHRAAPGGAALDEEFERAGLRVVGLRAFEGLVYHARGGDVAAGYESRDRGMAHVFRWFRERYHQSDKIAIWAHNWHVATATHLIAAPFDPPPPVGYGGRSMGTLLREALGERYFAIGLVGYRVSINWKGLHEGPIHVPTEASVEGRLHGIGKPYLLVDLALPGAAEPFFVPGLRYPMNLVDNFEHEDAVVPREQFGALLFLDESPAMDALLW